MTTDAGAAAPTGRAAWLTDFALLLAVALMMTRATMLEFVRDPFANTTTSGPGAATTVVLDALAWLPALLVLTRRAVDRSFALRHNSAWLIAAALAAWAACSVGWASDKFLAAVSASTLAAAVATGWAVTQCVRGPAGLRVVVAGAAGVLLVLLTQAALQRFVEFPETLAYWETHRDEFFAKQGWPPDGMLARQYELKVRAGEITGFTASTNGFAAVIALTFFSVLGVVIDRVVRARSTYALPASRSPRDRDDKNAETPSSKQLDAAALVILFAVVAGAAVVLILSPSRTAQGLAMLCCVAGGVAWTLRGWLRRRARLAFALFVGAFTAGWAGVIAWGMTFHSLVHESLTFRWNYWVASWALFRDHLAGGVGWANFGPSYLQYRLARAAEEPRDPHNLFVRCATELGAVGLLLGGAALVRLAWVTVRPAKSIGGAKPQAATRWVTAVVVLGTVYGALSILANVDLGVLAGSAGGQADASSGAVYDLIKRAVFVLLAASGAAAVFYSAAPARAGDAAPLVRLGVIVGLLGFFLHGLLDYAFFDTGPMFVAVVLVGAAYGENGRHSARASLGRARRFAPLVVFTIAWIAGTLLFTLPVIQSESLASEAVDAQRMAGADGVSPDRAARFQAVAATKLVSAYDAAPVRDADYAVRQAEALQLAGAAPLDVLAAYDRAVAADPLGNRVQLDRARFRRKLPDANAFRLQIDSDYSAVLARNPRDLYSRLEYASWLMSVGARAQAEAQFRLVLETNDGFDAAEPKRLPATQLKFVNDVLRLLRS